MMRRTIYTCYSLLLATVLLPGTISCTSHCGTVDESRLSYIDTRVGTAPSATHTAGLFGRDTEEYGQTLPAVLEPNGMNFWTAQPRDTEEKCIITQILCCKAFVTPTGLWADVRRTTVL